MSVQQFIHRQRVTGRRAVALAFRILPAAAARRMRGLAGRLGDADAGDADDARSPIFRYWSHQHLRPQLQALEIDSPDMLYLNQIRDAARPDGEPVRVLSLGSSLCSRSIQLAMRLRAEGIDARFTCIDLNARQARAGSDLARDCGISACMHFTTLDCERPFELPAQDVIIVDQFFHRIRNLTTLCHSLRASLAPDGVLASTDIVGRNGHMLWPDVAAMVDAAWTGLPADKRMDRHFGRVQAHYQPIDHAAFSSQGVRSQDVVAELAEAFDFELFFTFGGAVMPFVGCRLGANFDPQNAADRGFIDTVHVRDAAALARGDYPASNMIATLRHKGQVTRPRHVPLTPRQHAALVQAQLEKTGRAHATRHRQRHPA